MKWNCWNRPESADVTFPTRFSSNFCPMPKIQFNRWSRYLLVLALGASAAGLRAGSSLLENSPFVPADGSAAAGMNPESLPLELCSVVKLGDDYEFSIYDPA